MSDSYLGVVITSTVGTFQDVPECPSITIPTLSSLSPGLIPVCLSVTSCNLFLPQGLRYDVITVGWNSHLISLVFLLPGTPLYDLWCNYAAWTAIIRCIQTLASFSSGCL